MAAQYFGLHGNCRLLSGERDLNFQLTCSDGAQYVLKIANAAEDPLVTDFQNQALLHIQQCDPLLPVQRVYPNLGGTYQVPVLFDGAPLLVRLLELGETIAHLSCLRYAGEVRRVLDDDGLYRFSLAN